MGHPIFDAPTFPWARPDAKELARLLLLVYKSGPAISLVYDSAANGLDPLNEGQPPKLVWREALENLARASSLKDFCDVVLSDTKNQQLKAAIQAVIAAQSDVDRSVLGGILVVDRLKTRQLLGGLTVRGSPLAMLLVRGPAKTGKTWCHFLFDAAAAEAGAEPVYVGEGMAATVEELVTQLFAAVPALDKVPPKLTTYDAWYGSVCTQLLASAIEKDKRFWIAIDDLGFDENGVTLLDDEIRNFCAKFGQQMKGTQFRERFRLMFIGYPDKTPTMWAGETYKVDTLTPTDIQVDQVIEFLDAWSRERNKKIVAATLTSMSTDLVATIDAPPGAGEAALPRLKRMNDALMSLTEQLEQP
jgi:hypothetical protein